MFFVFVKAGDGQREKKRVRRNEEYGWMAALWMD